MAAQVIPFNFESREVRTLLVDDQPWFVAMDVADALHYSDAQAMTRRLDDDEIQNRQIVGFGNRGVIIINESGLYSAILRSRKAEAKRFKKWVTAEVLPAIRKHGHYDDAEGKMSTLIGQTIGTDGFHMLGALIKGKVVNLPAVVQRRATAKLWAQTHAAFGVRSAADIPADQLDAARNFVAAYAIEGEYLGCIEEDGARLSNDQLIHLNALALHMDWSWRIFQRHRLYEHLTGLGSKAGIEMIDHLKDGVLHGGILQRQLGQHIEQARHHLPRH